MDPFTTGKVKWDPNRGASGNLGDWDTGLTSYVYGRQRENLNGVYTLRLVVEDQMGRTAEARVVVTVAREITRETGGIAESCDCKAFLTVPPGATVAPFLLVSIQPIDPERTPAPMEIKLPRDLSLVGKVYEFQPPALKLMKPATFRLLFDDVDLIQKAADGSLRKPLLGGLGIYEYQAVEEVWRRLPNCKITPGAKEVRADIKEVTRYVAFYAVMADVTPPEPPTLEAETAETEKSKVRVSGNAEPYSTVEILDGENVKWVADVTGDGTFSAPAFPLKQGENALSARAVDGAGNKSKPSAPLRIVRRLHPPKVVKAVEILGTPKAERDARYLVKLVGEDSDNKVNTCWVRVASDIDPKGFELELVETGPQTGVYVATFLVGAKTDPAKRIIAASRHGEKITAVAAQDDTKRAFIEYVDTVPPTAPTIESGTHPSVCQDGFEEGASPFDQWANIDEGYGALCTRESRGGQSYLKLTKQQYQGHLGAWARQTAHSAARFPLVVFDYLINPEVKMDVQVNHRGWQLVEFNDDKGEDPAFGRKAIGRFQGIVSDGQWQSATLNLGSILAARNPGDGELKVEGIQFINWDKPAYMKLQFGRTGQKGSYWSVDNFRILGYGGPRAEFKWSAEDENGIAGYSYVFDQKADTIPPEKSMGMVTEQGFDGLADGRWYLHVRAVDKPGNWGPTNHYMIFVDTKPPSARPVGPTGKVAWDTPVQIRFDDSNGSGVNPYSIRLKVGGTVYTTDNDALAFDPEKQVLTFDPKAHALRSADERSVEKLPLLFADGEKLDVELLAAADHARHAMAKLPSWSYDVTSPLKVAPANPDGKNGWYVTPPKIEMKAPEGARVEYAWAVPVEEDDLFRRGNSINRLTVTVTGKDGKQQRYAKPFRLDTTVPKVTAKVIPEKPGPDGVYAQPPTVVLSHDDYAVIEGGLSCEGYATEDCSGAPLFRQEKAPFGAFEPPADVANEVRSARWTGRIRPAETSIYKLWLAFGKGQCVQVFINNELVLDSAKAREGEQEVGTDLLLVRKMHALDVRWPKAGKGKPDVKLSWQPEKSDQRQDVASDALFALRSLATIFCRWDDGKEAEYTKPLTAPPGRHVLRFRAIDEAGHAGKEEAVTVETAAR
ncbi:MAG TPA: Ig-like domain-containing protein [Planctomycetota bacterium]|nr:Ig-like domain-containing protein [Planctomycetota bacterium]